MGFGSSHVFNDASEQLGRLGEYKETVVRLLPDLPRDYIDTWSILDIDALILQGFFHCFPRNVVVLEIGTFVGVSSFHFASHPKVVRVIGVDPNPSIADEINDKSHMTGMTIDSEPLQNLKVLDVARMALAEYGDLQQKVELRVGTVGLSQVGVQGGTLDGLEKVEAPVLVPSEGTSLVAFVDGLHTRQGVRSDLEAIFEKNLHAVAILDDCRNTWGPFVQVGVVDFIEESRRRYQFRLFGDLGPGLATSRLGILYPESEAVEMQQTLAELRGLFSQRLDPLGLLRREEELIATINRLNPELKQTQELKEEFKARNSRLNQELKEHKERNSRLKKRVAKLEQRVAYYTTSRR